MNQRSRLCLLVGLGFASACHLNSEADRNLPEAGDEGDGFHIVADVFASPIRDLDILFVIDKSNSMRDEQQSLAAWSQDALFGILKTRALEPFSLHVGVVSSDMGANGYSVTNCSNAGDNGRMSNEPQVEGCLGPSDRYIVNVLDDDGQRRANHPGTVADAFSCIAQLGIEGCGFEQPLKAMQSALDGSQPDNAGFLRPKALLAVLFVSDEDDCSAAESFPSIFSPTSVDELGAFTGFRCFEHGVICEPDTPYSVGSHSSCRSREGSAFVTSLAHYAEFLRSLKPDPSLIIVGGVTTPDDEVVVGRDDAGNPRLMGACGGGSTPAVRLREFAAGFPARHSMASICNESLQQPLSEVAQRITAVANQSPCLEGAIGDPARCLVSLVHDMGETRLPACDGAGSKTCYAIDRAPDQCPNTLSRLAVQVDSEQPLADDARIIVRCP